MPVIRKIDRFTESIERDVFDIDSDFSFNPITKKDRNTIIEYLEKKYNAHDSIHVAYVGTKSYYSAKSALRDIASVFDIPASETFGMTKFYNDENSVDENIRRHEKIKNYFEKYPEIKEILPKILGTISNFGVHAGGVIISDKKYPLNEYCALQKTKENSVVATMFDKDELQNYMGFVKLDILQVTALSQIAYVKHLVGDKNIYQDYEIDEEVIHEISTKKKNKNIFQFESDLGKRCFSDFPMKTIDDISNASGLIRILGTTAGREVYETYKKNVNAFFKGDTEFWKRELRKEVIDDRNYLICLDVLEKTYGVMIYQEQLARLIEGFSQGKLNFSDGNWARKGLEKMIKKYGLVDNIKNKKVLAEWHKDIMAILNKYVLPYIGEKELDEKSKAFIDFKFDAKGKLIIPDKGILKWFIVSGTYLFSRVHDIAYSITSYNQMYQKYHYPQQFWTAAFYCDDKKKIYNYYSAMKSESNIVMLPPDINRSGYNFECEGTTAIRYGLSAILNLDKAAYAIVTERKKGKFTSFDDFLNRMDLYKTINKKVVESLIYVNAFSEFGKPEELYSQYYDFREEDKNDRLKFSEKTLVANEFELLGINISFRTAEMDQAKNYYPISEIQENARRNCCFVVKKVTQKKTKNGKDYLLVAVQCLNKETTHNLFCWNANESLKPNVMYIGEISKSNDFLNLRGIK